MRSKNKIRRPALRYHGGKWLLAPWIISHFPPHRIYVEPFGGAASVLLRKERSYSEVYNDLWDTVVNVFRVLQDPDAAKELQRRLYLTPYARNEFMKCSEERIASIVNPIERARLTILRSFSGFGSASTNAQHVTGFRGNANRSGTTPAHDWANYPACIQHFTERLRGVVIENREYQFICRQHDSEKTLVYFDPPYKHETRNLKRGNSMYIHEMNNAEHEELIRFACGIKSMSVISGYDNDLYNDLLPGWHKVRRRALADGARERTEVLWLSPNIELQQLFTAKK